MKIAGKQAAENFLHQSFPHCQVAFLAGSAARGELTSHSDLDIVILDETQTSTYRKCSFCFDWNIETFVYHHPASLFFAFDVSRLDGVPSIPRMCAEGLVLRDNGSAADIQYRSNECLNKGPIEWTKEQKQSMRFMITNLLDDFNSYTNRNEKIFVAYKLFDYVAEFVLRENRRWIGYGKWMYRSLRDFDEDFSEKYLDVFEHFMKTEKSEPLSSFIEKVLERHGGRLFGGYKEPL